VTGLFACRPSEEEFIEQCDYLKSKETHEQLNALYQRYKSTNVVGTWSSDPETQLKQERFMKARAETVEAAALRGSTFQGNLQQFNFIGNQWKKLEAIPGETKFKILKDYYPQLKRRVGFMISNFMSKYLYTRCPQASIRISYKRQHELNYYRSVEFPYATFEFESKGDFEKCQSELPMLTLEPKSLTSSLYSLESLYEALLLKRPLYEGLEEIIKIKKLEEDLGYFLGKYHLQRRDDNNTEYKDDLNNYFMSIGYIFPRLQGQGPFPSPTRPVSASGGQSRCNLKRSRRRKSKSKPKNKTQSKPKNKTQSKPKNKTQLKPKYKTKKNK
jgi:hypothetical protein